MAPQVTHARYGFRVAGLQLVPATLVLTEMVAQARVFPVPKSAAALVGVINLRGTIVPLFDPKVLGQTHTDIRPSQRRAMVFGRENERAGLALAADPELLTLVSPSFTPPRPDSPLAEFLVQPWTPQVGDPLDIWWELDHRAAFEFLARHHHSGSHPEATHAVSDLT